MDSRNDLRPLKLSSPQVYLPPSPRFLAQSCLLILYGSGRIPISAAERRRARFGFDPRTRSWPAALPGNLALSIDGAPGNLPILQDFARVSAAIRVGWLLETCRPIVLRGGNTIGRERNFTQGLDYRLQDHDLWGPRWLQPARAHRRRTVARELQFRGSAGPLVCVNRTVMG